MFNIRPHWAYMSLQKIMWYIVGQESKPCNSDFCKKTTFCQFRNAKRMAHILSNYRRSRPIRTPLKGINHASKYRIYDTFHYFWCSFYQDTRFCHEKAAQNVVTGWFFTKKWSKCRNSSETLPNDRNIFFGSSKHQ